MAEMSSLGWGVGGEAWVWRRQLRGWEEEMLGECRDRLLYSWSVSASDFSRLGYYGCCDRAHLAYSGSLEGLHLRVASFARQDAERLNQHNTYSSLVVLLILFGLLSVLGLTLHRWILIRYQINLWSLHLQRAGGPS
ncbi:hypothetical protein TSUD_183740 [Trifolium subterraneum]|uniref:Uncharacterized protein n=1 Tax=Trifolium subterraneum TaxID=3900 RepID=A0A2Z6LU57_TRISU|nr:hypothetical protein TSUD_183740 [Trifolium subterraneum]